jgi:hypothetical protein
MCEAKHEKEWREGIKCEENLFWQNEINMKERTKCESAW